MRPVLCLYLALLCALLAAWQVSAQGVLTLGAGSAGGKAAYIGPGDVVSGAIEWWGLRAYSSAQATGSQNAVDLVDQAGANPLTGVKILSSGSLDVATISTWVTAHSVTTILISKLYDQVGAHDLIQATNANRPRLVLSGLGSLPVIRFVATSATSITNATFAQAQSFTISMVAKATGSAATSGFAGDNVGVEVGLTSTNTAFIFAGSFKTASATTNVMHALQLVGNGVSSDVNVDGSSNTVSPGTNGLAAGAFSYGGANDFSDGDSTEMGVWNFAFTPTQSSNVSSNQHTYWGF